MRSRVFKQSYAMAAESRKVPLEIFSNPTILADDHSFSESPVFFTPSRSGGVGATSGALSGEAKASPAHIGGTPQHACPVLAGWPGSITIYCWKVISNMVI